MTRAAARPDRSLRAVALPTEHESQCHLVEWAELLSGRHPELALLLAIPNGGYRSRRTAGRMKAEGLRAGVPDLLLPCARGVYHALFIELKREARGRVSVSQAWWHEALRAEHYRVDVCAGADAAKRAILEYLNLTSV